MPTKSLKRLFEAFDQLGHKINNYHLILLDNFGYSNLDQWRHRLLGSMQFEYKESFNQDLWYGLSLHGGANFVLSCVPHICPTAQTLCVAMMTSLNGKIFRVTGPLCGEIPSKRPATRSFDVFFDLHLNKRFSKQ